MLQKIEEWRFGHGPESGSNERARGLMLYCSPHDVQVRTLPERYHIITTATNTQSGLSPPRIALPRRTSIDRRRLADDLSGGDSVSAKYIFLL